MPCGGSHRRITSSLGKRLQRPSNRDEMHCLSLLSRYYKLITREAEIQATDQDEYAHCEHMPNGDLLVRIGLMAGSDGAKKTPYFQRTFHPQETREVRIYLRGGDDRAEILQEPRDGLPFASTAEAGTTRSLTHPKREPQRPGFTIIAGRIGSPKAGAQKSTRAPTSVPPHQFSARGMHWTGASRR